MVLIAVVLCARTKEIVIQNKILLVDVIALILVSKKQNIWHELPS